MAPSSPEAQIKVALLAPPLLSALVALVLRHLAAECRTASSREDPTSAIRRSKPDLVVADVDQYPNAAELSHADSKPIPVLGLLRRRDAQAKLDAFERGLHDILEVPFTPDEIVVRSIAVVTRATGRKIAVTPRISMGRIQMDVMEPGVLVEGKPISLTVLERTLLYLFLAQPGTVLGRDEILRNIWGSDTAVTSNVIDRHIRDLRVKLGENWREPRFIETVAGQGYRFISDDAGARVQA